MSIAMIDSRYYGRIMMRARKSARLRRTDAASILQIKKADLVRYESGRAPVPEIIMMRLIANAYLMLQVRTINRLG